MDITFAGDKITLVGKEVKVGDEAQNFTATKADLSDFNLDELKGKVVVISAAPSLDTSVCAFQAQRFNKEASDLSDDVAIVNITVDLPFAQKRFCDAYEIGNTITVSDYKNLSLIHI